MAGADERGRTSGRFVGVAVLTTTITALAVAGVALWVGGHLNGLICDGDCGPAAAAVPDSLTLRAAPAAADVRLPPAVEPDGGAVRSAVVSVLDDEKLGEQVGFAAVDPRTGAVLATEGTGPFVPASTVKLLTAFAVLSTVDPQRHFVTSVVRSGDQLVLVGGGDPYLMAKPPRRPHPAITANLRDLADQTALAVGSGTSVRLGYDASMFSGPALNPSWEDSYVTEQLVTPISSLWADQVLRSQREDPAASAAEEFAALLEKRDVDVAGGPTAVTAPRGAAAIAEVRGGTVAQATELMIAASDNDAAEILLRHAAVARGRPGSFRDGVAVVSEILGGHGIDASGLDLRDGSGLSRKNRVSPLTLAQVIAKAAGEPRTSGLVASLPVARFSGTLENRFATSDDAGGAVRAKTGTLTGVHSLAGYVTDRNGAPIAFAVMADKTKDISGVETEAALDRVGEALARCACSRPR